MLKWGSKCLMGCMLLVCGLVYAQKPAADFKAEATWIKMIDAPNVNYYEAIKTYNDYWETHPKPSDPEDRLLEPKPKDGDGDDKVTLSKQEKIYEDEMIYQVKRFENWVRMVKPFVQDDGRILTDAERMAIWKKQQEEKQK